MSQYITDIAPYFAQLSPDEKALLNPAFQNAGAQQAYMNQQLAQGSQMAQPSSHGVNVSGLSPLAMAAMLRKKKPEMMGGSETPNWSNPYANYDNGATSGSSGIE
jgi:hypothetical protein